MVFFWDSSYPKTILSLNFLKNSQFSFGENKRFFILRLVNAVEILVNEHRPDIDRKSSSEFAPCRLQDVIV